MYIVELRNGDDQPFEIHGPNHKLLKGTVVQGVNTIDSFTFTDLPGNPAFGNVHDLKTLVSVYNENKKRYEFFGRVLSAVTSMNASGLLSHEVTCESCLGFLCDSLQSYKPEQSYTIAGFLAYVLQVHNSRINTEPYKQFMLGDISDGDVEIYTDVQYECTWETIKKKLLEVRGGEIGFRVEEDGVYLDYKKELGVSSDTPITLSKNMKSIVKEIDPSTVVTRLIPLGAKLKDGEDRETEERLTISGINGGLNYIDDDEAKTKYGIVEGIFEFDDIHNASTLYEAGERWLTDNNRLRVKYSVTALDLSLIGLDVDDFRVHNYHTITNPLLGIDTVARITKKTIDVCDETKSTFEIGESFKTLSEIQTEQIANLGKINADVKVIKKNYVTNTQLAQITKPTVTTTLISQTEEEIQLKVSAGYLLDNGAQEEATAALIGLNVWYDPVAEESGSIMTFDADVVRFTSGQLQINSGALIITNDLIKINCDNFKLSYSGAVEASDIEITGGSVDVHDENNNHIRLNVGYNGISEWVYGAENFVDGTEPYYCGVRIMGMGMAFASYKGLTPGVKSEVKSAIMNLLGTGQGIFEGTWWTQSEIAVFSDRNLKHDIETLDPRYDTFFDAITARRFKYNNGTSDRYHSGFITQEIQSALADAGIDEKEFAGICTVKQGTDEEVSALRYAEFIALNTWQIQKLKNKIKELEERLTAI